ncbi:acylphosphatase [Serinibacter salmoneus]|uniref:Acylphosphatase n=1 Tax=Serinibacter salmoneus TaxID=556530 RepID=A0A2A9D3G7_9MICO|nr:acylphosphatase [Serinibacter salmoneus]PFG21247.1 acylphosphatase [Serinibacter salmoneus]
MRRVNARITGVVQGVGFRWSAQSQAEALGLTGWVRNRRDGSVEAEIQGPPGAVERMLTWLREGPSTARVSDVVVRERELVRENGFDQRSTA